MQQKQNTNAFNGRDIEKLVSKAIQGNGTANTKLGELFNMEVSLTSKPNKVEIDSIKTKTGKTFYTVLAEYPNPVLNRFAVYSSNMHLYLLDKSLNGYLTLSKAGNTTPNLILIKENFVSKDTLMLERTSAYIINDSSVFLSLRIYTKMLKDNFEYGQLTGEMSVDKIKTSLIGPVGCPIYNQVDVFTYDSLSHTYKSEQNLFDNFVTKEIKNFRHVPKKLQITDAKSAAQSLGMPPETIISDTSGKKSGNEFGMELDESWKELKNVPVSSHLNRAFTGTKFINKKLKSSICVIVLPEPDSTEKFINLVLDKKSTGNYVVRYHDKIGSGKNYVQYFEYHCKAKRFLLILEVPKINYEKNKDVYGNIVSTFYMGC
jgi:hypothetical protein